MERDVSACDVAGWVLHKHLHTHMHAHMRTHSQEQRIRQQEIWAKDPARFSKLSQETNPFQLLGLRDLHECVSVQSRAENRFEFLSLLMKNELRICLNG